MKTLPSLKAFTLLFFAFYSVAGLHSQTALGIKAGLTASNIITIFDVGIDENNEEPRLSVHFGYLMRTHLTDLLYFQPELLYMEKGFREDYTDIFGNENSATVRFRNINMPLLLGIRLHNFQIAAGPEIEYFIKAHSKANDEKYSQNPVFGKNAWLFNANLELGYQLDRLQLSVRGSLGLKPVLEGNMTDVNGVTIGAFSYRHIALQAALAYMIFE